MNSQKQCSKCGTVLPPDAPAGVCPKCLLQAGMDDFSDITVGDATLITNPELNVNRADEPATERDAPQSPQAPPVGSTLRYFGDYELLTEIARGGMGVVYKARQVRLNRIVALKMILAGQFAGPADVQRFQTEAEAAAQSDHPGIVPIFEVGQYDGHHFFSMGLVEGESLARRITDGPLAIREAADIVRSIAEAVQYAHDKGVIHRDLKPANVLLDKKGQPKLTDFGLAKRIEGDSNLTGTGQILGTPSYMPPEQAAGRISDVRETADVYSLGAVLYATLTGRPPFQADNPLDTLMQVLEREPVAPRTLNPKVAHDLDTICLKCLQKDRRNRYSTAQELADELGRWLRGEPIVARPVGQRERLEKWVRRHPAVAGLLTAVVVTMLAGSAVSAWFGVQSHFAAKSEAEARLNADEKRRLAERLADEKDRLAEAERAANTALRELNTRLQLDNALNRLEQGHVVDGLFGLTHALDGPSEKLEAVVRANLALWKSNLHQLHSEHQFDGPVTRIVPLNQGKQVAFLIARDRSPVGECRLWDIEQKQPIGDPLILPKSTPLAQFTAATLLSDPTTLLAATSQGFLHRWNLETGQPVGSPVQIPPVEPLRSAPAINFLAVSPDGQRLLAASRQSRVAWLLDPDSLQPVGEPLMTKGWISCVDFTNDSSTALIGLGGGEGYVARGEVLLWNARTGEPAVKPIPHSGRVLSLDTNHKAELLAIGGSDHCVTIWDLATRLPTGVRFVHDAPVTHVGFSPNVSMLVSADTDGTIQIADPRSGHLPGSRLAQGDSVTDQAFDSLGKHLLTASADGSLKIWRIGTGWEPELQWPFPGLVSKVVVDDQQRTARIAWHGSATEAAALQTWDLMNARPVDPPQLLGPPNSSMALSADLRWAVTWQPQTDDGKPNFLQQVDLWDVAARTSRTISLAEATPVPATTAATASTLRIVYHVEFAPGSRYLLIAASPIIGPQGRVWIYDTLVGKLIGKPMAYLHPANPRILEQGVRLPIFRFDPAREHLLCADLKGVKIWNLETAQKVFAGPKLPDLVREVAYSSRGELIAIAAGREVITVSPIDSGGSEPTALRRLSHASLVRTVAFSPQGNLLATGSDDRVVRLWNVATGAADGKPLAHPARITRVAFNSEGTRVVVVCDREIFLWDVSTRKRLGPVISHPAGIGLLEFTPNSGLLLTSGEDHALRWWNVNRTSTRSAPAERTDIESQSGFKRDGEPMQATQETPGE